MQAQEKQKKKKISTNVLELTLPETVVFRVAFFLLNILSLFFRFFHRFFLFLCNHPHSHDGTFAASHTHVIAS